jgi:hypothetical protein
MEHEHGGNGYKSQTIDDRNQLLAGSDAGERIVNSPKPYRKSLPGVHVGIILNPPHRRSV